MQSIEQITDAKTGVTVRRYYEETHIPPPAKDPKKAYQEATNTADKIKAIAQAVGLE